MPSGILVEKNGSLKEIDCDEVDETEYYNLVGMKRKSKDFKKHTKWEVKMDGKQYIIQLYGKDKGNAGQENKYDFPPPVDETLFFGPCLLINTKKDGTIKNLSKSLWTSIYEHLFGGFEDIGDEDSEDDEEEDEDDDISKTKEGYAKDGFIVDDVDDDDDDEEDEDEEEEDEDEEEEDDEDEPPVPRRKSSRKTKTDAAKQINNVFIALQSKIDDDSLDCTSELSEEEYL